MANTSKKYICLICREPSIMWLDFLKTFKEYNIYIVIDDNSIDYKEKYKGYDTINIIQVSSEECKKKGYRNITFSFKREITAWDKALYYFSEINILYDTIWFIEDDVFFKNEETLLNIDSKYTDHDLLSNRIISKEEQIASGNKWHWFSIRIPISPPYYRCMCCAVRLSRTFISIIKKYVDKHNTLLFHEIMFPTLSIQNKLINAVPDELRNIYYRKNYKINDIDINSLYHPVKDMDEHIAFRLK